jgi:hypothetical protein
MQGMDEPINVLAKQSSIKPHLMTQQGKRFWGGLDT